MEQPVAHRRRLRTTGPAESPFAAPRPRIEAAKRDHKVSRATAVIWKILGVAERSFRNLKAPELLDEAWHGARLTEGQRA